MSTVEELKNAILRDLLTDFESHNRTFEDLHDSYSGPNLAVLTQRCRDAVVAASPVDFDIALKDLEGGDLVSTGPMDFSRIPGVIAVFSKREYAYLTEKGYRAAKALISKRPPAPPSPRVHISGGHFHQSPIGVGNNINQSVTGGTPRQTPVFLELRDAIAQIPNEDDRATLRAGVEAMATAQDTPDYVSRYSNFMQLAANHMTVIAPFIPALAALLTGQ